MDNPNPTCKQILFLTIFRKSIKKGLLTFFILFSVHALGQEIKRVDAQLVSRVNCQLGEGAFWDSNRNILWFVDIEKGNVHGYKPSSKEVSSFSTGQKLGTLVPAAQKNVLVLGLQSGIFKSDFKGKNLIKIAVPFNLKPNQRLNDGKCDPAGRFWVGGMSMDEKNNRSNLYMMDDKKNIVVKLDSISISNGIVWRRDGKKMFYIDTPTRTVKSFDFEVNTGQITNQKIAIQTPDSLGWPDGMTIDENDNLYIGMWGGGCVSIWNSNSGKLIGKVVVDAKNVTSCAFGGSDRRTLYITTARQGLSRTELDQYPLSGHLFSARMETPGPQMNYWKPTNNKK